MWNVIYGLPYSCDKTIPLKIKKLELYQSYLWSYNVTLFLSHQGVRKVKTVFSYSREGDLYRLEDLIVAFVTC